MAVETDRVAKRSGRPIEAEGSIVLTADDQGGGTLADGIRFLWRGRSWFAIPALIGAVVGLIGVFYFGLLSPSSTTYRNAISLTMVGAQPGKYSNGLPYAPSDLRSPGVLHQVHRQNNLDRYGMNAVQFSAAIAVEAYSPVQVGVVERFRAQLRDRNLTTEERRALEDQFRLALSQAQSDGVIVSFTVPDNFRIPPDVAAKVVTDVPAVWSQLYTEVLGVAEPLIARSEAPLIDPDLAGSLDYPLAFDYIVDALHGLRNRLATMMDQPGAMNAVTPDSNLTIYDLQRSADRIVSISIDKVLRPIVDSGVSREPLLTGLSYENQIEQLQDQERLANARAQVVSNVIEEGARTDGRQPPANSQPGNPPLMSSGTSIPQFGDSFIDRIIDLSVSGAGVEFRQTLLDKKLKLGEEAATLTRDRETAERRLAGIRAFNASTGSTELTAKFSEVLGTVVVETNMLWTQANLLLDTISDQLVNEDKRLYSSLPIEGREIRTSFVASTYLWMLFVGAVLTFGLAGLALYILRAIIGYRKRSA